MASALGEEEESPAAADREDMEDDNDQQLSPGDFNQLLDLSFTDVGKSWTQVSRERRGNGRGRTSFGNARLPPPHGRQTTERESVPNPSFETSASVRGRVVVIEPVGEENVVKRFMGKAVVIAQLLAKSEFGAAGIIDVRTNYQKKSLTVVMSTKNKIEELTKVRKLGDWEVRCFQPSSHQRIYGVIGPIGEDTTAAEVSELLEMKEEQAGLTVERLYKGTGANKVVTKCIKVGFSSDTLPEHVYLGYIRFMVKPYVDKPYQCYRCQGFGHGAKFCTAKKQTCVICSGDHKLADCPKEARKCANCGSEGHGASYAGCPKMKEAKKVEKIRATKNVTYREALLINKTPRPDGNNNIYTTEESQARQTDLEDHSTQSTREEGPRARTAPLSNRGSPPWQENALVPKQLRYVTPVCR